MKIIYLIIALALTGSSYCMADEPSGGTLIEMSSVGGLILITSLMMLFGSKKPDSKLARMASKFFPGKR